MGIMTYRKLQVFRRINPAAAAVPVQATQQRVASRPSRQRGQTIPCKAPSSKCRHRVTRPAASPVPGQTIRGNLSLYPGYKPAKCCQNVGYVFATHPGSLMLTFGRLSPISASAIAIR